MCKVIEDMLTEEREDAAKRKTIEIVKRMLRTGKYMLEEIVDITGLPPEEVKKLQSGQSI